MLTEKIKTATQQYHQQTEKILIGKMKSMRSLNDYSDILKIFYGYFGGVEQRIDQYINPTNLADYHERRKTAALESDLEALGNTLPRKAGDDDLPAITNYLQAFGALYVIEGSTLGGKIISKMVQQHLAINDGKGLSFFNGYGDDTGKKWSTFQQVLNSLANTPEHENEVIAAANNTFAKFKAWMEREIER
jgi:heme oxygenase (biliverdin-IX-beta and delta-forming)